MGSTYLKKLEYNKILELLSDNSVTYLGKDLCLNLTPTFKASRVSKLLKETSEARNIIIKKGPLPIIPIPNIDVYIKNLESSYTLTAKGLLDIAKNLKLSNELKDYFYKDENIDLSEYEILDNYFSSLYTNTKVQKQILDSILDEDNISDNASKVLSSLRKNRKKLEVNIKDILNDMIHSSYSKYIMEPIITIRNDRYVIPVKEEYRSNIKGFIHDVSSSGSTVFIEPMAVFEINNKIANLKIEESIEIEKVLANLSSLLFPLYEELKRNVELIGLLDFIFAKAKYANKISANCPNINEEKFICLNKARHPLIETDKVVPIDVEIGKNYSSLIITGPNTGGKTVSLKTIGLLTLMACSGLHIPANENSSIYVFDNVFADIGDEQSIKESLSTFSSHMLNTINILNNITDKSLVLLDELGSGTDPLEGACLATAILEYLNNSKCLTVATTHYQEIKNYALVTDGFENASSEFDVDNLKPTYKLLIGIPGKSNAFAISKKLGLKNDILEKAKSLLTKEEVNIEELLKNIYDDKIKIEMQKEETSKNLSQITDLRKQLENKNKIKLEKEAQIIDKAKLKAQEIVLSAKDDANSLIKELEDTIEKWKELDSIDINNLSDSEIANIVRNIDRDSVSKANKYRSKLNNTLSSIYNDNSNIEALDSISISKKDLKVGMKLKLNSISDVATIVSLSGKSNQLQVQVGSIKMSIDISDISDIVKNDAKETKSGVVSNIKTNSNKNIISKAMNVSTEINVIGQNVDEACFVIDKYLDDAALSKLQSVRIIHGKGTGKLREGIHKFLKVHPHVKNFRLGTFGEGEMGVTIVEIK